MRRRVYDRGIQNNELFREGKSGSLIYSFSENQTEEILSEQWNWKATNLEPIKCIINLQNSLPQVIGEANRLAKSRKSWDVCINSENIHTYTYEVAETGFLQGL